MWSTNMTPEEMTDATEKQRVLDLWTARCWLRRYEKEVEELEARDPLNLMSKAAE